MYCKCFTGMCPLRSGPQIWTQLMSWFLHCSEGDVNVEPFIFCILYRWITLKNINIIGCKYSLMRQTRDYLVSNWDTVRKGLWCMYIQVKCKYSSHCYWISYRASPYCLGSCTSDRAGPAFEFNIFFSYELKMSEQSEHPPSCRDPEPCFVW